MTEHTVVAPTYGDPTRTSPAEQEAMRKHMGYALTYANKINLAALTPQNELASSGKTQQFQAPLEGDAVLYLREQAAE